MVLPSLLYPARYGTSYWRLTFTRLKTVSRACRRIAGEICVSSPSDPAPAGRFADRFFRIRLAIYRARSGSSPGKPTRTAGPPPHGILWQNRLQCARIGGAGERTGRGFDGM